MLMQPHRHDCTSVAATTTHESDFFSHEFPVSTVEARPSKFDL